MKRYEDAYRMHLPRRLPVIIRIDGKSFHTFTAKMDRPFDTRLMSMLDSAATSLCVEIQGAQIAYIQSDEISILVHNYKHLNTDAYFDNNLQKICSISASIASSFMSRVFGRTVLFDARAFVLPEAEVCNYFIWRQQDWTRNSLQMMARSLYSHHELEGKNSSDLHELIYAAGQNWNNIETRFKRGRCIHRSAIDEIWVVDHEIPIFRDDRSYIEKWLAVESEESAA